ncbi:hypothetical protein ABPG72_006111 [Tetrahymena utriculariae]
MRNIIVILALILVACQGRSLTAYNYCKATQCSNQEEQCAIDTTGCMVPFKAYLNCLKANTVCSGLKSTDPFGECWTKCNQNSSNQLFKNLQSCYVSCGAAEHSAIFSTSFGLLFTLLLVIINI